VIEVVDYNPSHVDEIMSTWPRERELRFSQMGEWGNWKEIWRAPGASFTLMIDGKPVGCAGIVTITDGMGEAWAVLGNVIERYCKSAFWATKKGLEKIIREQKLKTVQSFVESDYEEGKHFLYHLGFVEVDADYSVLAPDGRPMIKFRRNC